MLPGIIRVAAGVFQCMPCTFQEDTLLGIHEFSFTRGIPEKFSIEILSAIDNATVPDIIRLPENRRIHSCCDQLFICKSIQGFKAVEEVLPVFVDVLCTGQPAGHADYCNFAFKVPDFI